MTLCAVFAVVITVIFILDIANEKTNYRILLLSLYFIMLFLSKACNSLPGTSSVLADGKDLLFLNELYVAPLYLYLALDLTGRKKYLLTAGVILWFLYEGTRVFLNIKGGMMSLANRKGLGALLLFIAVAAAFLLEYICGRAKKRKKEAYHISYGILTVVVSVFCVLYGAKEWEGDVGQYLFQVVYTVAHKNGFVAVYLFTNICAVMASIVLILEFIRRTIKTKEMLTVLEERSSLTLEGYNRVLKSEEATNSVRHEMLHHMTALMGIVRNGETERACEYISSVTDQILHLPAVRYSQNILVNVVAGTYLDKAKSQGIQVEYSLQVPVELKIADEDLCVFLTNMLQNALQACERMDREQERYIRVKMYLNEDFLFIGCVNSWSGDQDNSGDLADEKRGARRRHGFGLEAMSRIAEKYGSILKIDKSPREFSVKSNLCLRQWRD